MLKRVNSENAAWLQPEAASVAVIVPRDSSADLSALHAEEHQL